ncbi:hypothetical protein [Streptomyces chartreusis]|uniref:hypothetical protein n=1 Tax=Streptomyces chartreusis TaxID=1969 RepID=UPI002E1788D1
MQDMPPGAGESIHLKKSQPEGADERPYVSDPETSPGQRTTEGAIRSGCVGYAVALESIQMVIAWYSQALHAEEHSASPDTDRLKTLAAERRACVRDRKSLFDAGPDEVARVGRDYSALFRSLATD